MLAIVKEHAGEGYALKNVEKPKPKSGEVLIKVKSVGICGTDVPILKGLRPVPYPLIPGHEFAGDIVELGDNVINYKIGDRVTPSIVIGCGDCYYCRKGIEVLCDNILETGIHLDGAFAQYVTVPEKVLHKLPEGMSYETGASIDPIASAYRPIKKANIGSQDTVLVFGPGPIGLYTVQLAKAEGAKKIIVVGISGDEARLELAETLGADHSINLSKEDLLEKVGQYTDGKMADIVMEVTGNEEAFSLCLDSVRKEGKIVLIGINHKSTTSNIEKIVRKEIKIEGSICYTWLDYKECIQLVNSGKISVEPLISHHFNLRDIDQAMKEIDMKQTIKVMLHL
ncbi:MAG: alcohol dehydrogenase catalytic domain-containing protein [Proteocatella sp.]